MPRLRNNLSSARASSKPTCTRPTAKCKPPRGVLLRATRLSINLSDSYADAPVQARDCNTTFTRFCLVSLYKSKRFWKNSARTGENDPSPKREWRALRKEVGVSTNHRFSRQVKPRAVLCCFGKERILTLSITSGQCIGCDGTYYDVAPDCSIGFLGKSKVVCLKISNVLL